MDTPQIDNGFMYSDRSFYKSDMHRILMHGSMKNFHHFKKNRKISTEGAILTRLQSDQLIMLQNSNKEIIEQVLIILKEHGIKNLFIWDISSEEFAKLLNKYDFIYPDLMGRPHIRDLIARESKVVDFIHTKNKVVLNCYTTKQPSVAKLSQDKDLVEVLRNPDKFGAGHLLLLHHKDPSAASNEDFECGASVTIKPEYRIEVGKIVCHSSPRNILFTNTDTIEKNTAIINNIKNLVKSSPGKIVATTISVLMHRNIGHEVTIIIDVNKSGEIRSIDFFNSHVGSNIELDSIFFAPILIFLKEAGLLSSEFEAAISDLDHTTQRTEMPMIYKKLRDSECFCDVTYEVEDLQSQGMDGLCMRHSSNLRDNACNLMLSLDSGVCARDRRTLEAFKEISRNFRLIEKNYIQDLTMASETSYEWYRDYIKKFELISTKGSFSIENWCNDICNLINSELRRSGINGRLNDIKVMINKDNNLEIEFVKPPSLDRIELEVFSRIKNNLFGSLKVATSLEKRIYAESKTYTNESKSDNNAIVWEKTLRFATNLFKSNLFNKKMADVTVTKKMSRRQKRAYKRKQKELKVKEAKKMKRERELLEKGGIKITLKNPKLNAKNITIKRPNDQDYENNSKKLKLDSADNNRPATNGRGIFS